MILFVMNIKKYIDRLGFNTISLNRNLAYLKRILFFIDSINSFSIASDSSFDKEMVLWAIAVCVVILFKGTFTILGLPFSYQCKKLLIVCLLGMLR